MQDAMLQTMLHAGDACIRSPDAGGHGGAMKYMLIHCVDESAELSPDDDGREHGSAERSLAAWVEEMEGRGVLVHGDRLQPVAAAMTVRVRGSEVLIADGPFAETKEQVAGYDVIECADLDEAIEVASAHPTARIGTVEVRPLWQP